MVTGKAKLGIEVDFGPYPIYRNRYADTYATTYRTNYCSESTVSASDARTNGLIGTASATVSASCTGNCKAWETFTLPGGIFVRFTGHDVRHADGGQLQRKGLTPHVEIAPTRAGLSAGKDEVLDRALEDIQQTLAQEARDKEKKAP